MIRLQFKRIIQNGKFIPEIDGLRFLAIASVLLFHINVFLSNKNINSYKIDYDSNLIPSFITSGYLGVELFFAISGFILSSMFAKAYFNFKRVDLKNYFKRRLSRLEPPYILVMLILLLASVYISRTIDFKEGLKSFFSSIFYIHNFVYGRPVLPKLNVVAWSLEVEVQFYILAPLIGFIFKLKKNKTRRFLLLLIAILSPILNHYLNLNFISILDFIQYFIVGALIADLYFEKREKSIVIKWSVLLLNILTIATILVFFKSSNYMESHFQRLPELGIKILGNLTHIGLLYALFYLVLFCKGLPVLKNQLVTNIGGACYSIYLIHYPIISFFGKYLVSAPLTNYKLIDNIIFTMILLSIILFISAIFYLLIERPCMKSNWYQTLQTKIKRLTT